MLLLTGVMPALFAQDAVRKGVVTDELGLPLERVSVQVKGTTSGSFTDAKGQFSLSASPNAVLVFTMVGFQRIEVPAAEVGGNFSLRLTKNESQLTEVVVTALGVNRSRNQMPYAVQTIKGMRYPRSERPTLYRGFPVRSPA